MYSDTLTQETSSVWVAVEEMATALTRVTDVTITAENEASQNDKNISEGQSSMQLAVDSMTTLQSEFGHTQQAMEGLISESAQGSGVLDVIKSIAEQTNVVALNAAIEAARAGEQGRGFAVVADEVRVLSQRTHASTQEIQQMIETLQSTTTKAVGMMDDSRQLTDISVNDADSAAVSLTQIQSAVERISDMATQIASAAEEQASVTSEITRNTVSTRDVSQDLAEEAHSAAAQASQLSELSHELENETPRFQL